MIKKIYKLNNNSKYPKKKKEYEIILQHIELILSF